MSVKEDCDRLARYVSRNCEQSFAGFNRGRQQHYVAWLARFRKLESIAAGDRSGDFEQPHIQVDVFAGEGTQFARSQSRIDG